MDLLIRQSSTDATGQQRDFERDLQRERITLGSAPSSDIQCLGWGIGAVAAELRMRGASPWLICIDNAPLLLNGQPLKKAALQPGDRFSLADNQFEVLQPLVGFDLGVQVQRPELQDAAAFENAFVTDLSETAWSIRRFAWVFVLATILLTALLPLGGLELRERGYPELPAAVPSDAFWSSGPLHPAHQLALGDNCRACHQEPFVQVRDQACSSCHKDTQAHEAPAVSAKLSEGEPRCASCHREHNEPMPALVIKQDRLCTDCHSLGETVARAEPKLAAVSGFGSARHPRFSATVLRYSPLPEQPVRWLAVAAQGEQTREQSHLIFPHQTHLDPEQVQHAVSGEAMACADCHQLDARGEHFEPLSMEQQCQSCHELTFDPQNPDRQLPHGEPEEVVFALEGYFLKRLAGDAQASEQGSRRRRPDRRAETEQCRGYDCALQQAASAAESQFTVRGCVSCHRVEQRLDAPLAQRYAVLPVRLNDDYFPSARFDHRSHAVLTVSGDSEPKRDSQACLTCHDAQRSQRSEDLLMPAIDNCEQCHSSPGGDFEQHALAPLACGDCHSYHPHQPVDRSLSRSISP